MKINLTEAEQNALACRCDNGLCPLHNEASDGYVEHEVTGLIAVVEGILGDRLASPSSLPAPGEHLRRAKQTADANAAGGISTADSPDARTIPYLLAGILDALIAIAEHPQPEPGPCWASANVAWPGGIEPRCHLRAGHAGAHECDRGLMGGTAVWTDDE